MVDTMNFKIKVLIKLESKCWIILKVTNKIMSLLNHSYEYYFLDKGGGRRQWMLACPTNPTINLLIKERHLIVRK